MKKKGKNLQEIERERLWEEREDWRQFVPYKMKTFFVEEREVAELNIL
jgi:hypothetical protein